MCQRYPNKDYIAATLSRPVIHLLHSYSFTLWTDRNAFIYGANAKEVSGKHIRMLVTNITSAYQHQVSIPRWKRTSLWSLPDPKDSAHPLPNGGMASYFLCWTGPTNQPSETRPKLAGQNLPVSRLLYSTLLPIWNYLILLVPIGGASRSSATHHPSPSRVTLTIKFPYSIFGISAIICTPEFIFDDCKNSSSAAGAVLLTTMRQG